MNDNQNHLVRRPTSRVLAQPGGGSSLSFGLAPSPPPVKQQKAPIVEEPTVTTMKAEEKEEGAVVTTKEENEEEVSNQQDDSHEKASTIDAPTLTTTTQPKPADNSNSLSANAFVSGSNMNGGCVMTGRPTSRVLAPPGGHTSIKLG